MEFGLYNNNVHFSFSYWKLVILKTVMEYEYIGAIKIKDGLFLGDQFAA
jgi:hypothetical protein